MKVPLKWLNEYVDVTIPADKLARKITLAGFETLAVPTMKVSWENVCVGQIVEVNLHPNADRLRLPTVDVGGQKMTVVCGAPNLRVGDKIAFARVGAELIDGHTGQLSKLKEAKIRGVASSGMVCSEKELGLGESHEGILVLPPDAPVGKPLAEYLGDYILDLEVTPNRADCLSIIGVGHEVAALTGTPLHEPDLSYPETDTPIDQHISVEIADPDLCSRYCATLITGVKIGPSPAWMQQKLQACGQRPINNVVDVTNYVMLEYGQPLHSFDYSLIRDKKIIVRRAREGEEFLSLDGVDRKLSHDMLVIADNQRAVAVAGIMGGANSEVMEGTTSILLEAANFNPASIHYTGAKLCLPSEARLRFERGIQTGLTVPAIKRATQLIIQLAGGVAAKGIADAYPGKKEPKVITLTTEKVKKTLGVEFSLEQILTTLKSLGFECEAASPTSLKATPPYWRGDINQAVDLVEEVARIIGYAQIPSTLLAEPLPPQNPEPIIGLKHAIKNNLVGYGFQEAITFSMTNMNALARLSPEQKPLQPALLKLFNPMNPDMEYLRPTLRSNLLALAADNRKHEEGAIQLFELGRVYLPRDRDLLDEVETLCGVMSRSGQEKVWLGDARPYDFFDVKGIVESLLKQLGITAQFSPGEDAALHPQKQAAVTVNGKVLGVLGEVHPRVLAAFEISEPAFLFELNVQLLTEVMPKVKEFRPVPKFPAIVRDIALIVDEAVTNKQMVDAMLSYPLVVDVTLFDVYSGKQVPAGKKSVAYRITYQSPDHTLTDDEVSGVQAKLLERLNRQYGAVLRT